MQKHIFFIFPRYFIHCETFARTEILFLNKVKARTKNEFILINDQLSTLLTQFREKVTIVQRSQCKFKF